MKTLKELIADYIGTDGKNLESITKTFLLSGFTEHEIRVTIREALMDQTFVLSGMTIKTSSPPKKHKDEVKADKDGNVNLPYIPPTSTKPYIGKPKDSYGEWIKKIKDILDEESKIAPATPYKPYFPDGVYYPPKNNCIKCGMNLSNAMGFVCPDVHCPTFIKAWC